MKYLLDNNISYRYAAMLRALDLDIEALRERFPQDIRDVDLYAASAFRSASSGDVVNSGSDFAVWPKATDATSNVATATRIK